MKSIFEKMLPSSLRQFHESARALPATSKSKYFCRSTKEPGTMLPWSGFFLDKPI